jgi:hypothetical protein
MQNDVGLNVLAPENPKLWITSQFVDKIFFLKFQPWIFITFLSSFQGQILLNFLLS